GRSLVELSADNYESFLNGWQQDNRIRILFITTDQKVRLRYLITAYKYREYAAFAHIHVTMCPSSAHHGGHQATSSQAQSRILESQAVTFSSLLASRPALLERYSLSGSMRWMLIFAENSSWPEAVLSS